MLEICPAPEETFTTRPKPCSIIPGMISWHSIKGPNRFVSIVE